MPRQSQHWYQSLILCTTLTLSGCQSAYYAAMEKVGVHKRDILIDRVEEARDAQQESQQQFKDALDQLSQLINFDGGQLQSVYEQLNDEYTASQAAADNVSQRISKVESVANALFTEWRDELTQYENQKLRSQSERKLKETERQFNALLKSMRKAERKMTPVLKTMQDNVLYLKHNLNAKAIGAIKGEFSGLQKNVSSLVDEMNKAITESNRFINQMQQES